MHYQKLRSLFKCGTVCLFFLGAWPLQHASADTGIVVLAAGLGSRMKSDLPKALQQIDGRPMIYYILDAIRTVSKEIPIAVVVGHKKELVQQYISQEPRFDDMNITFVDQPQQLGTGHAARCAMDSKWGEDRVRNNDDVLVLPGDLPLITPKMIDAMISPLPKDSLMKLMTTILDNPTGYGRIVRNGIGSVLHIVEEKDADAEQKQIREVGVSIYTFNSQFLFKGLHGLNTKNAQKEYYLTDLVAMAAELDSHIPVITWNNQEDLRGVNTVDELKEATTFMLKRLGITGIN